MLGWVRGPKIGELTLGKRPARIGIRNYVQGATIPSKDFLFCINKLQYQIQHYNVYVQYKRKILLPICRLKINHVTKERNIRLFLAQWSVQLRTIICITVQLCTVCCTFTCCKFFTALLAFAKRGSIWNIFKRSTCTVYGTWGTYLHVVQNIEYREHVDT
jgi:hypothetical protein